MLGLLERMSVRFNLPSLIKDDLLFLFYCFYISNVVINKDMFLVHDFLISGGRETKVNIVCRGVVWSTVCMVGQL